MSKSKKWFYVGPDDENVGPVKAGEIRERVADGTITKSTLVWREGMEEWVEAGRIRKLWASSGEVEAAR